MRAGGLIQSARSHSGFLIQNPGARFKTRRAFLEFSRLHMAIYAPVAEGIDKNGYMEGEIDECHC